MKYRLMDLLACPMCRHFPLELHIISKKEYPSRKLPSEPPLCELYCAYQNKYIKELSSRPPCEECIKWEVEEGAIYCPSCGRWYPIIDSIPHMLPDYIREKEKQDELDFLERNKDRLPEKIVYKGKPHSLPQKV